MFQQFSLSEDAPVRNMSTNWGMPVLYVCHPILIPYNKQALDGAIVI